MSAQAIERQLRCAECGYRLLDYENAIESGVVVVEIKCRKPDCGHMNRLTLTGNSR